MKLGPAGIVAALLLIARPSAGAFECLPGPGGAGADPEWRPPPLQAGRRAWSAEVMLGRPASVGGLGWSYASVRRRWKRFGAAADAYVLGLDDLYHETALGVWGGWRPAAIGIRRWRAAWGDGTARAGTTYSGAVRLAVPRGPVLDFVALDVGAGSRDPSGPASRLGITATIPASRGVDLRIGPYRDGAARGLMAGVRWAPRAEVALDEQVRVPGVALRTGLALQARGGAAFLWVEPSVPLGARFGMSCRFE